MCVCARNSQSRHHTAVKQARPASTSDRREKKKTACKEAVGVVVPVMQVIAHSREHSAFIGAFEGDQRIVPHHLVAVIAKSRQLR